MQGQPSARPCRPKRPPIERFPDTHTAGGRVADGYGVKIASTRPPTRRRRHRPAPPIQLILAGDVPVPTTPDPRPHRLHHAGGDPLVLGSRHRVIQIDTDRNLLLTSAKRRSAQTGSAASKPSPPTRDRRRSGTPGDAGQDRRTGRDPPRAARRSAGRCVVLGEALAQSRAQPRSLRSWSRRAQPHSPTGSAGRPSLSDSIIATPIGFANTAGVRDAVIARLTNEAVRREPGKRAP